MPQAKTPSARGPELQAGRDGHQPGHCAGLFVSVPPQDYSKGKGEIRGEEQRQDWVKGQRENGEVVGRSQGSDRQGSVKASATGAVRFW